MLNIYDDFEEIGNDVELGNDARIGYRATIGNWVKIGNDAEIDDNVKIGDFLTIGNGAGIGYNVEIGDGAKIGDKVRIADNVEIGDGAGIGDKFRCEGLEVIDFFTMANVDGTGRKIHIYVHTKGVTVRAGCFKDSLDEFCMKAEDEGKHLYSTTVRAAAEAFAAELQRQGKTGGWDK
jgi:NDP-sugar pyrophosphorylase family protein